VFALDLMSTYEGERTIFGLLGQANLTQNDVLQFHPLIDKHSLPTFFATLPFLPLRFSNGSGHCLLCVVDRYKTYCTDASALSLSWNREAPKDMAEGGKGQLHYVP
jgi:hypothetical protein